MLSSFHSDDLSSSGSNTILIKPTRLIPMLAISFLVMSLIQLKVTNAQEAKNAEEERFFTENILPILETHCLECHSHESGMEGGLTLDSRSGWTTGGEHGPAISVGKPDESLLIKAVRHQVKNLQMPPEEKLSDAKIKLLVDWVKQGAVDPRTANSAKKKFDGSPLNWWSLQPLKRPDIPINVRTNNSKEHTKPNPIDAFVRRKLAEKNLSLSPPADRRTLIRRLYFDLHGLPPTPEIVSTFIADKSPDAYEKLVDRLLDSPRYGERWARHWLDTVHFADSHGCEHDVFRGNAWPYRDYVIDSFNRDTPWPRFIREQLAADHFFPNQKNLTPALGFIAAGPLELSRASTAPITFDYLDRDDMVAQTMAAFASTTANCARCHDHKFDPVTQEDYYSLQAVFAGIGKGDVLYDADAVIAKQRQDWQSLLEYSKSSEIEHRKKLLADEYVTIVKKWEKKFGNKPLAWETLAPSGFTSSSGSTLKQLADDSLLASGTRPEKDTYTITASSSLKRLTAIRLDVLADASLPLNGPGRQDNGNLHLTEFEVSLHNPENAKAEPIRLKIRKATADWDQQGWTIAHAIDGNIKTAWGIYPKVGESHFAVFELEKPQPLSPSDQIVIVLKQLHGGGHLIGRTKLSVTDADEAIASIEVLPAPVIAALKIQHDQRSEAQQAAIAAHAIQIHAQKKLAVLPPQSAVYAVSNSYSHGNKLANPMTPKVVNVLHRGDIHKPGKVANAGALSVLTELADQFELENPSDESARRAGLADWLAASENPLTWRSVVNRVWAYHFGQGLCDTLNDFGRMGGEPSHPELLDWLAVWFRDDAKGSLKKIHRLILLSATYQQASGSPSNSSPDKTKVPQSIDAENRLLWRMNRNKMDAESFRDAVLQLSGRIDLTMGGPGIQQFTQTKGPQATPKLDYDAFDWNDSKAARRSIYRVVWRGIADPFMESLDFPDLGLLSPKRGSSGSALQALMLFNNDFVLHHSEVLAKNIETNHQLIDEQIAIACRWIFLREPASAEQQMLVAYAKKHGLAATCRVLLNSNEFVFVD